MVDLKKEIKRNENLFDQLFQKESKSLNGGKDKDVFDVLCEDD